MPSERSSRQKVRPMRSNIKQVRKVWARILHAIHTSETPLYCSHLQYQIRQMLVIRTITHQMLVIWQKNLPNHATTLLLPSLLKAKSLISNKSCNTKSPQSCHSDKLDPEEFEQTRRWICKKLETITDNKTPPKQVLKKNKGNQSKKKYELKASKWNQLWAINHHWRRNRIFNAELAVSIKPQWLAGIQMPILQFHIQTEMVSQHSKCRICSLHQTVMVSHISTNFPKKLSGNRHI